MRRFHLLSFVAAVLVASVLLGLSLQGKFDRDEVGLWNMSIGNYSYGFPKASIHFKATIYYEGREGIASINGLNFESMQPFQNGRLHVEDKIGQR